MRLYASCIMLLLLGIAARPGSAQEKISVANPLIDRSTPDSASQITFVDSSLVFAAAGKLISWDMYTGGKGRIHLQVYPPLESEHNYLHNYTISTQLSYVSTFRSTVQLLELRRCGHSCATIESKLSLQMLRSTLSFQRAITVLSRLVRLEKSTVAGYLANQLLS